MACWFHSHFHVATNTSVAPKVNYFSQQHTQSDQDEEIGASVSVEFMIGSTDDTEEDNNAASDIRLFVTDFIGQTGPQKLDFPSETVT